MKSPSSERVRFADFEFDCRSGELRRAGHPLKLQPQPAKVLAFLIQRAGNVVTRQELSEQVWGQDTVVDFEQGLNYAVRQIRIVLEDDPDHPKFLETLPKRGYRFIAPVTAETPAPTSPEPEPPVAESPTPPLQEPVQHSPALLRYRFALPTLAVAAIALGLFAFRRDELGPHWLGSSAGAGRHRIESLAVLPLHNLSNDAEQEYFSEGMTDELIADLSKMSDLRVTSHTSVERYKGTKRSIPEIARDLNVDAVIEGTVKRADDRVRITVQLIDGRTDQHLWVETYERSTQDLLNLQDEVARHLATEIGIKLTSVQLLRLNRVAPVDQAAHEAYLKGKFYRNQLSCHQLEKALGFYQDAIARDPGFALAHVGLADAYFDFAESACGNSIGSAAADVPQNESFASSKAAALKALELDSSLGAAHHALGKLAFYQEWDWPKAERELKRSLELDVNDAATRITYALFLVAQGRREEGLAELMKAHALDPVSQVTSMRESQIFYLVHDFDRAIEQANKTIEMYPLSYAAYYWLGQSYEQKGMGEQAFEAYSIGLGSPTPAWNNQEWSKNVRLPFQRDGMPGFWRHRANEKIRAGLTDSCFRMFDYAHTKDKEQTLKWLEWGYENHCAGLQFLMVEPIYDSFRSEPRFKALTNRLGLSGRKE